MSQRVHKETGWRLFLRTVRGRAYPRVMGYGRQPSEALIIARNGPSPHRPVCLRVCLSRYPCAGSLYRLRDPGRRHERVLGECAVGHVQPILLGAANRKPGAVHHRAQLIDGYFTGNGERRYRDLPRCAPPIIILLGAWPDFTVRFVMRSAGVTMVTLVFLLTLTALYAMGMMFASLFQLFGREAAISSNFLKSLPTCCQEHISPSGA